MTSLRKYCVRHHGTGCFYQRSDESRGRIYVKDVVDAVSVDSVDEALELRNSLTALGDDVSLMLTVDALVQTMHAMHALT